MLFFDMPAGCSKMRVAMSGGLEKKGVPLSWEIPMSCHVPGFAWMSGRTLEATRGSPMDRLWRPAEPLFIPAGGYVET